MHQLRAGSRACSPMLWAVLLTTGCVPTVEAPRPQVAAQAPVRQIVPPVVPPGATPKPPASLVSAVTALGRGFDGKVGIAVRDVQAGWLVSFNGAAMFPQQSVSKLWVALTVMDAVDRGALSLSDEVVVRPSDLTVFHQPIKPLVTAAGYRTTIGKLLEGAMTRSDNTCNDVLLWKVGGPSAVRRMLAAKGLGGIEFGPGERQLQAQIAGLEWRPEWAGGAGFLQARSTMTYEARSRALERYVDRPYDGAAPEGITYGLARLRQGQLLSPGSTATLLTLMAQSHTGPRRMRAGLGPGWALAHKTGTGQDLGTLGTGYNDVGVLTAPDGRTYAVAVMIASTRRPIVSRMQLMAEVVRAVVRTAPSAGAS
ncbi:MAG: beta-lactamase [Sphingomonas bacterium]|nr:beta-lactamase [Sphingomonas bacterium]